MACTSLPMQSHSHIETSLPDKLEAGDITFDESMLVTLFVLLLHNRHETLPRLGCQRPLGQPVHNTPRSVDSAIAVRASLANARFQPRLANKACFAFGGIRRCRRCSLNCNHQTKRYQCDPYAVRHGDSFCIEPDQI